MEKLEVLSLCLLFCVIVSEASVEKRPLTSLYMQHAAIFDVCKENKNLAFSPLQLEL